MRRFDPSPRARSRLREAAVSAFVSLHLLALTWWNFGTIAIPSSPETVPGDRLHAAWRGFTAAADLVDPGHRARDVLEGWMRVSGTFQMWRMFSPDAPQESGWIAFFGVTGHDRNGQTIVDPEPFRTTDDEDLGDRLVHIPKPPCGWLEMDDPRTRFFVRSYALFRLREHVEATGAPYVGVRYVCFVDRLPDDDATEPTRAYELVVWEGTL